MFLFYKRVKELELGSLIILPMRGSSIQRTHYQCRLLVNFARRLVVPMIQNADRQTSPTRTDFVEYSKPPRPDPSPRSVIRPAIPEDDGHVETVKANDTKDAFPVRAGSSSDVETCSCSRSTRFGSANYPNALVTRFLADRRTPRYRRACRRS